MHIPQVKNSHPHLIYACSTSENFTSPLNLLTLGGEKKDNDFGYKGVSCCCKIKIYESFIHDPFEWMAMEINKMDG
jgi:hypothetical protein